MAEPEEIIRGWKAIERRVKKSRVQLWRDIRDGKFPAPIELGPNSIGWPCAEIDQWQASRPRRTYRSDPAASVASAPAA